MQSGGGGGNGLNRQSGGGGLTRYRSAPVTWLDALLEADDENDTVLLDTTSILSSSTAAAGSVSKQSLLPPPSSSGVAAASSVNASQTSTMQVCSVSSRFGSDLELLDSLGSDGGGLTGLLRQQSSPAEFLSDGYFSSGFGVSGNYEYIMSSSLSLEGSEPAAKRAREADSDRFLSRANSPAVKIEQSGQLHGEAYSYPFDAEMEKLSEDAVLCKVRAKRGCATHPRSIAERVRRTRISDRIRKLQELVPNMDKQTNTADMLDEAVEYVAFLQKQIQELTEQQKKCKCFTKD